MLPLWMVGMILCLQAMAQSADSVVLPAIPRKLFWENAAPLRMQQNSLTITAGEKTDMFRDPNVTYNTDNAPKLLFKADENFILSASIEHAFENKWDGGALVIKSDSLHWIKFCFEKDYTGARRVVSVVTMDISDHSNAMEVLSNKAFFKVAKAENVITLYYSDTGKHWLLIRHFQFNAQPPLYVGFLAQSPTGKKCVVTFSDIRYSKKKIADPYVGE